MKIEFSELINGTKQEMIKKFVIELYKLRENGKIRTSSVIIHSTLLELTLANFNSENQLKDKLKNISIDMIEFKDDLNTEYHILVYLIHSLTLDTDEAFINIIFENNLESISMKLKSPSI